MEFVAIIWLGLAIATGAAARWRGRDGFGWFLLAVIISPLLALILLIAFQPKRRGASKLCKFCRSEIDRHAVICPHCQSDISMTPLEISNHNAAVDGQLSGDDGSLTWRCRSAWAMLNALRTGLRRISAIGLSPLAVSDTREAQFVHVNCNSENCTSGDR